MGVQVLRLGARQVGLHQLRRVVQQLVLPVPQAHTAFDQAAHHADMLGPAHRIAAHQLVAAELQAQVAAGGRLGQLDMLAARIRSL